MSLGPRTKLGAFQILEPLGAGGMGEVYRARDSALKREVAIKVLPDSLAQDPDRVARFEREARLLASLNHPNIGAIHGLEKNDGTVFLVLELVEGDTLAGRMEQGPLPAREALVLFRQVASALEAAHGRGIVHRDLKPENIKITPEGVVKVLDFGLAKELVEATPSGSRFSKTRTAPLKMTRDGDVLGTPAYMSPEQARGHQLDKRTDIWSFGCCLFEVLAGRHPFHGRTLSDILAAVISTEPDFKLLPSGVPGNIIRLLRRCLQKETHRRLNDVGDARLEIEEALEAPPAPDVELSGRRASYWVIGLVALGAVLAGFSLRGLLDRAPARPEMVRRFTIEIPPAEPVALGGGPALALSPDGSRLVYTVRRGETTELRLRPMDRLEPTRLPGTEGARNPFFSPEADALGFFSGGKLWRLSLASLTAEPLFGAESPRGASWSPGRIVSAPFTMGGLVASSASNPTPAAVTEPSEGERSHRWPSILPGGSHALFTSWSEGGFRIDAVDLDSGDRRALLDRGSYGRYARSGHLVFARDGSLWAAPFDVAATELEGEAVEVLSGVRYDALTGAAFYDFSDDGTLVYVPSENVSDEASGQLLGLDRVGTPRLMFPAAQSYQVPRLSPSGRQVLLTITEEDGSTNVWLFDMDRGTMSRVSFRGNSAVAIWHPDGSRFTFSSDRDGGWDLYTSAAEATDSGVRLTSSPSPKFPNAWSPDGAYLAYTDLSLETQFDISLWSRDEGTSEPFLATPFNESGAVFSADGGFVAYVSDETGADEVYVRSFQGSNKWPISVGGGREPVWGGSELFYRSGDVMMAVDILRDPEFRPGRPRPLFEAPYDEAGAPYANYSVARDGSEFIMVRSNQESAATRLTVVLGWFRELSARVPTNR